MTDLRDTVLDAIVAVAPDVPRAEADKSDDLWFDNDLDSMDQLGVMVAIVEQTGMEIPEADYPKLISVDTIVAYLREMQAQRNSA